MAEVVKKITINGNKRISDETIKIYGDIELNKDYTDEDLDKILKNFIQQIFLKTLKFQLK